MDFVSIFCDHLMNVFLSMFPSPQSCEVILSNARCSQIILLIQIKVMVVLVMLVMTEVSGENQAAISSDFACTIHVYTINSTL